MTKIIMDLNTDQKYTEDDNDLFIKSMCWAMGIPAHLILGTKPPEPYIDTTATEIPEHIAITHQEKTDTI